MAEKGQKVERDRLEFEGEVIESSNAQFRVQVADNYTVLCSLAGKVRLNVIKILVHDSVKIEVSEFDPSRGRITYRLR